MLPENGVSFAVETAKTLDDRFVLLEVVSQRQTLQESGEHLKMSNEISPNKSRGQNGSSLRKRDFTSEFALPVRGVCQQNSRLSS
jgi:hypothetical protein